MVKFSEGIEAAQTGTIMVLAGIGIMILIIVSRYFKSAEDKTLKTLSPYDVARYEKESALTKLGVVLDKTVTGGAVRESGQGYAQATYDYYYQQDPTKAQRYAELSGIGRTMVSLGDSLTAGYASKAGESFAKLWR